MVDNINKRLHGLDILRSLAIILVYFYHYGRLFSSPEVITSIGKFGWTGVDLFFVLSGYLISSHLFEEILSKEVSFKNYFIKRFFRIIPVYLVVLLAYFLFPMFREREALAPLWKYLTFTQNIGLDLRYQGTFSHAWSLCIEEQFYLFLPLILWILIYFKAVHKIFPILFILFILGFVFRLYNWSNFVSPFTNTNVFIIYWYKWIYYLTICRLDGLITGVFIAAIFAFKPMCKKKISTYAPGLLMISLVLLLGAYYICQNEESFIASIFGFPIISIGYGMMLLAAISPASILYRSKFSFTKKLAELSFALYLSHKIIIHLTQEWIAVPLSIEKDSWIMLIICVFTSLLSAYVLNLLIEKPFLRIRNMVLNFRSVDQLLID